jgi:pSer/pThr/pTyr-binding forkhead associated (FHA) protein
VVWAVLQLGRERQTGKALGTAVPSPQEVVPRAFLYDLSGATESELHEVCKKVTVIGRLVSPATPDAAYGRLLLNDPTISRRHAIIEYSHQGFWLIDQRSRNGTYVGEERVLEAVCLKHNDRITLSKVEFEFHIAAMDDAAETVLIAAR